MSADIASLKQDRQDYQEQLDIVDAQLKDDPENAELSALYEELRSAVTLLDESINELKPPSQPAPPPKEPSPPPAPEKWSRENHPAYKKAAPPPPGEKEPEPSPVSYQVNDEILAKWMSGDKGFYPARITSITGSSSSRIYTVSFKGYNATETLRSKDLKPVQKTQKRKQDATGPASSTTTTASLPTSAPAISQETATAGGPTEAPPVTNGNGTVFSAAASLYPEKVLEAKRAAEKEAEGSQPKRKKIKAKKELEAGKNKWKEFSSKGKFGKTQKKDSMFRTPDGVHARVGFTGSGQAMRKDPTRSRHVYAPNEEPE